MPARTIYAAGMDNAGRYHDDNITITLTFGDGSVGNILYLANGDKSLPKERIEVFCQEATAVLDDFVRLKLYRDNRRKVRKSTQDKGHSAETRAFVEAVCNGTESPIPFDELVHSTQLTLGVLESLSLAQSIVVGPMV